MAEILGSRRRTTATRIAQNGTVTVVIAAMVAAMALAIPAPAHANGKGLAALVAAGILICAAGGCEGKPKGKAPKGGGKKVATKNPGGVDAIDLTSDQRVLVQQGLQGRGFYSGSIDGKFGNGTRTAIRNWQSASGYAVSGVLTGVQINQLIAASPAYAGLAVDDPRLFVAEVAPDLDKDGIRRLQAALLAAGFDPGPADGAMGRKTREAIMAYKATKGLPGDAVPTVRLLAAVEDRDFVPEAAPVVVAGKIAGKDDQGNAVMPEPAPVEDPIFAPAEVDTYEIAGVRLGLTDDEIADVLADEIAAETGMVFSKLDAGPDVFGGNALFSSAHMWTQANWPQPGSQQFVSFHDEATPEFGAFAVVRTVILPEELTREDFDAIILPDMIAAYGRDTLVDNHLQWIGDKTQRDAARVSEAARASCGMVEVSARDITTPVDVLTWTTASGPTLAPETLTSVAASCGDVMTVSFEKGLMTMALWSSDFILRNAPAAVGAAKPAAPKIKF